MVDGSLFIFFFIFVRCLWRFPMMSAVVAGLGLMVVFMPLGLVSSLSRSTAAGYKIKLRSVGF